MDIHISVYTYIIKPMNNAVSFFNVLSDPTRLRIIMLIEQEGELCVCEIMHGLGESQPKISRHLAYMRKSGSVSSRREGVWMHYRINPDIPAWARKILRETSTQLQYLEPFKNDKRKLSTMINRPGAKCA